MPEAIQKLIWPLAALGALLVFNAVMNPALFIVEINDGRLTGSLIDVLDRATPVILLALGMTLVIATAGVDLSVGAVMAICGAASAWAISNEYGLAAALVIGLAAGLVCGLWNGVLVAILGIQPIVATLILMVAGRGVAQMITEGRILTFSHEGLAFFGAGDVLGVPTPIHRACYASLKPYADGSR